ncbi:MAG: hypothetical protein OEM96_07395, partial [Gemmatimonadota bacterium]|nr:hypothetical protein [Gemmatimonadota bacterium]
GFTFSVENSPLGVDCVGKTHADLPVPDAGIRINYASNAVASSPEQNRAIGRVFQKTTVPPSPASELSRLPLARLNANVSRPR